MKNQTQNQKGPSSYLVILILIVSGLLAIGAVLGYQYFWPFEEIKPQILKILKKAETANWEIYTKGKASLRYPNDIWQMKDKDFPNSFYIKTDGYFINKKMDTCESWVGISVLGKNGYEMCSNPVLAIGECGGDENIEIECEIPKTEEIERIKLNDKISAERTVWTMHTEEKIEAWYDIYNQESNNIYCVALFGFPDSWEECLDNFEQILSTFRFIE